AVALQGRLRFAKGELSLRLGSILSATMFMASASASAQEVMNADVARSFIAGRQFSYTCFDGTNGSGKIFADRSALGSIRVSGTGPTRYLHLPVGTLFVRDNRVCASLRGLFFEPCFNLTKTGETSFRGAVSGLSFMYCDFNRADRTQVARKRGTSK